MFPVALAVFAGLLCLLWLGRRIRDFDRKMVAAGQRRKTESEARAAVAAAVGQSGRLAAYRADDGVVHYAVQLAGDARAHRLVFEKPDASGEAVAFRLLPV